MWQNFIYSFHNEKRQIEIFNEWKSTDLIVLWGVWLSKQIVKDKTKDPRKGTLTDKAMTKGGGDITKTKRSHIDIYYDILNNKVQLHIKG